MADQPKPAGRKRGPKPKGEAAMSGAERNRLYRQRKREQQAKEQGMPTPEEWQRAKRVVDAVEENLGRIYNSLKIVRRGIDQDDMKSVKSGVRDLLTPCCIMARAVGLEHLLWRYQWRDGLKIWLDPQTALLEYGDEFPEDFDFKNETWLALTTDMPEIAEHEAVRAKAREALKKDDSTPTAT